MNEKRHRKQPPAFLVINELKKMVNSKKLILKCGKFFKQLFIFIKNNFYRQPVWLSGVQRLAADTQVLGSISKSITSITGMAAPLGAPLGAAIPVILYVPVLTQFTRSLGFDSHIHSMFYTHDRTAGSVYRPAVTSERLNTSAVYRNFK